MPLCPLFFIPPCADVLGSRGAVSDPGTGWWLCLKAPLLSGVSSREAQPGPRLGVAPANTVTSVSLPSCGSSASITDVTGTCRRRKLLEAAAESGLLLSPTQPGCVLPGQLSASTTQAPDSCVLCGQGGVGACKHIEKPPWANPVSISGLATGPVVANTTCVAWHTSSNGDGFAGSATAGSGLLPREAVAFHRTAEALQLAFHRIISVGKAS